jgi:hypothetical protein
MTPDINVSVTLTPGRRLKQALKCAGIEHGGLNVPLKTVKDES